MSERVLIYPARRLIRTVGNRPPRPGRQPGPLPPGPGTNHLACWATLPGRHRDRSWARRTDAHLGGDREGACAEWPSGWCWSLTPTRTHLGLACPVRRPASTRALGTLFPDLADGDVVRVGQGGPSSALHHPPGTAGRPPPGLLDAGGPRAVHRRPSSLAGAARWSPTPEGDVAAYLRSSRGASPLWSRGLLFPGHWDPVPGPAPGKIREYREHRLARERPSLLGGSWKPVVRAAAPPT